MIPAIKRGDILIIDDEDDVGRLLRYNLKTEGFNVHNCARVDEVNRQDLQQMRLVIVSAVGHNASGIDLIKDIRSDTRLSNVAIILCSNPEGEEFIVKAFEYGIDDYLVKPYSLREMLARINAVLRRFPNHPPVIRNKVIEEITLHNLDLKLDITNRKLTKGNSVVPLTKTEYAILEFLVKHPNNFYTRDKIFEELWDGDSKVNVRIVDTNISRLRKKLGETSKCLLNRYGLGYAFFDKE